MKDKWGFLIIAAAILLGDFISLYILMKFLNGGYMSVIVYS